RARPTPRAPSYLRLAHSRKHLFEADQNLDRSRSLEQKAVLIYSCHKHEFVCMENSCLSNHRSHKIEQPNGPPCPLLGQKRTFSDVRRMSALPQKRTFIKRVGASALCYAAEWARATRAPRTRSINSSGAADS